MPSPWNRAALTLATIMSVGCSASAVRRVDVSPSLSARDVGVSVSLRADSGAAPSGDQMVAGWVGSVLGGFLAWRVFDEPDGQHSHVKSDWGYTPRALTALAVGSHVGATFGIWGRGRANGSRGSLLMTAGGVALATVPILARRDDPLLMLKVVAAWGPLQAYVGYTAYRMSVPPSAEVPAEVVAIRDAPSRARKSDELIVREELERTTARNVYDAIRQLRPHWMTAARLRSPTEREAAGEAGVMVAYVGGTRYGSVDALRQVSLAGVDEVRYYNAREATNLFGTGHPAGAVDVRMSRGP